MEQASLIIIKRVENGYLFESVVDSQSRTFVANDESEVLSLVFCSLVKPEDEEQPGQGCLFGEENQN